MKNVNVERVKIAFLSLVMLLFCMFGIVGFSNNPASGTVLADSSTQIGIGYDNGDGAYMTRESSVGRFRLAFTSPICDKNSGTASSFQAGGLSDLHGLQDKLLIAGKTPKEWSELDVGFSISFRTNMVPVFNFDKTKLTNFGLNFFDDEKYFVSLNEDCVLDNGYGTVKAFSIYSTGNDGAQQNSCGTDTLMMRTLSTRPEGPILYEGGSPLQIKFWFESAVIEKNGSSDVNINLNQLEGLQYSFYFNGKTLAEWSKEGALGVITARAGGGFILRFDTSKFSTANEYYVGIDKPIATTKGTIEPFKLYIKPNLTSGNIKDADGKDTGNGYICSDNLVLADSTYRKEGPFYYAGVVDNNLRFQMWFNQAVITSNMKSEPTITADEMEGLQNALYINGKTIAQWETAGVLKQITARSQGGFIFLFDNATFVDDDNYLIEIKESTTTKLGTVQPFCYWIKAGYTFGNIKSNDGTSYNGNGYPYENLGDIGLSNRTEGPFYFEKTTNTVLPMKMWFANNVIQANGSSDVSITVDKMEGLQNALYVNGKSLATWANEGILTGITARANGGFIFNFALGEGKFDYSDNYLFELKNDVMTSKGVVKAFSYWIKAGYTFGNIKSNDGTSYNGNGYPYENLGDIGLSNRTEGPFRFEKTNATVLPMKMWFANNVIQANGSSDVSITVDKMEGLQNALYVNGKSLATWANEGILTGITARTNGGFIFNFALGENKFDYSKDYTIELTKDVLTSKGIVKTFKWWIKNNYTLGNVLSDSGEYEGNAFDYNDLPEITIEYNANGGEGTMTGTTLSYGSAYTVLTNLFTKEGFDFLGFSKTLNGTVDYNSDDVLYLYKGQDLETLEDETITLYAVWKEQVEFTLSTATFEIRKDGTTNTLKFMFSNGTSTAPIIATDSGENINLSISKLEGGLENYLSIDGKSLSDWGVLLGNDLTVGNRATQNGVTNGRFAIRFPVSALGNNDFGGKNFVVELSQDVETSQGTVKAFKALLGYVKKTIVL
ncbi:MAG: hypothetical protein IJQ07_01765 [Clostridia bacterium]|nr:hypothetical protein [Clostridia bacterium]